MSAPHYCRPCGEVLTEEQNICPFCDAEASSVDDVMAAMFEERNRAFNEQVQRILSEEEARRG